MVRNVNNGNVYKNSSQMNFKRGLKVGCINVRGLVSNVSKRVELNHWLELNDLDVVCIQEWYVPHSRMTKIESKQLNLKDNNVNKNVNIECSVKTKKIDNGNKNKKMKTFWINLVSLCMKTSNAIMTIVVVKVLKILKMKRKMIKNI